MNNSIILKIAVLSIGDELIYGEIVDTNFTHIASRLYDRGLPVERHLTVGDAEESIVAALRELAAVSNAVIVSGGLGPTSDDRTTAAAAKAFGLKLQLHEEALAHLQSWSDRLGRDIVPANRKQALIPTGAALIPNPCGTACGFNITTDNCNLFFLPGVPSEMLTMMAAYVLPGISILQPDSRIFQTRTLKLFGASESAVGAVFNARPPLADGVTIAYCVNSPEILVKLRAEGTNPEIVAGNLESALATARLLLKEWLFAEGDDTLPSAVAALLVEKGQTLSVAESCTGGLIAKMLTDLPGSSAWFLEGAVTYSNAAKIRQLQVTSEILEKQGAVSTRTAEAMSIGIRTASGSGFSLAVTGIAGPGGGTEEKPVGTVCIALADETGCKAETFLFTGSRENIRTMTAYTALERLRRRLLTR